MAIELSYVIITPYSLLKSRTGGIVARLMSRTDLEFVGAQMLAFTPELAERYASELEADNKLNGTPKVGKLLGDYVRNNFTGGQKKERALMLLFKGEDACR